MFLESVPSMYPFQSFVIAHSFVHACIGKKRRNGGVSRARGVSRGVPPSSKLDHSSQLKTPHSRSKSFDLQINLLFLLLETEAPAHSWPQLKIVPVDKKNPLKNRLTQQTQKTSLHAQKASSKKGTFIGHDRSVSRWQQRVITKEASFYTHLFYSAKRFFEHVPRGAPPTALPDH